VRGGSAQGRPRLKVTAGRRRARPLALSARPGDQSLDALDALGDRLFLGAEGEAGVAAEARAATAAALPGIDVEEVARHADDLLLEGGLEEPHAVVERLGQGR